MPSTPAPAPLPPVNVKEWSQFQHDYQQRFAAETTPPGLQNWLAHAQANQCNQRELYQSIWDGLQFFKGVIAKEGRKFHQTEIVPNGLLQTDNYMAFSLQANQLTVIGTYNIGGNYAQQKDIEAKLRWILEPARAHSTPRPLNVTLFFNLHDGATPAHTTTTRPVFSVCRQAYWTDDNLLPTSDDRRALLKELQEEVASRHSPWQHEAPVFHKDFHDIFSFDTRDLLVPYHFGFDTDLPKNTKAVPFDQRKESIVWRGSTTGGVWGQAPRFRLVSNYGGKDVHPLSDTCPVQVDFAFVDVLQQPKTQTLAPGTRHGRQYRLKFNQLQEHKYIMDVDGNAFTQRFPGLLRSGSLIFKSTRYKEWYTERLRPYVDYIPVNYNLSDLAQKLEWAHQHADLTQQMVQHAQKVAQHHLRREDMRCYVYRLVLEYAELFDN